VHLETRRCHAYHFAPGILVLARARVIYQRVLDTVDKDPTAKASAGAALAGILARFTSIVRSEGKLDEANTQITALINEHPKALEPLMEKGYILQALAETAAIINWQAGPRHSKL
jgi:hypothetical protein